MKNYLPVVLIVALSAALFWVFYNPAVGETTKTAEDAGVQYLATIEEKLPGFLSEVGTHVSLFEQYKIWFLLYADVEFTVAPPKNDNELIDYWFYTKNYSSGILDLTCSDYLEYSGATAMHCMMLQYYVSSDKDDVVKLVADAKVSNYASLLSKTDFLSRMSGVDSVPKLVPCEEFSQMYPLDAEDFCNAASRANLLALCFNDGSELYNMAYREPSTIIEFVCYKNSYIYYKWLKGMSVDIISFDKMNI